MMEEQKYDFDKNQTPSVIRFAMPLKGEWELSDIIRGKVKFQNKVTLQRQDLRIL